MITAPILATEFSFGKFADGLAELLLFVSKGEIQKNLASK